MAAANSLLLELQSAVGCSFLSDLHHSRHLLNAQSSAKIMAIPLDQYSLEAWNEAAAYVMGKPCDYQSKEDVQKAIAVGK